MNKKYYAHSENKEGKKHDAKDHLTSVADLAHSFAVDFPCEDEVKLAGFLHDLGKYGDLFQARLRGEVSGLDHWSQGAWVALCKFKAVAAALAIHGHHIGLQQGNISELRKLEPSFLTKSHPLSLRLSDGDIERLKLRLIDDGIIISEPKRLIIDSSKLFKNPISAMLDVRMLFSCLTDADFLDTEAHFNGGERGKLFRDKGPILDTAASLNALEQYMVSRVRDSSNADEAVLEARNLLWKMVAVSSKKARGLFTLTAPTGSGKTLAMLKFALEHAAVNDLNRIILVIPYLSIIEQTATIYHEIFKEFPENYVLEHHSLSGLGKEDSSTDFESADAQFRKLLSENWDAPIIITTNVQLLESLFSNRSSACRKLHNLAKSIIMFDEVQTLPLSLAVPTLAALSHFSHTYRTTVLFATATQPAFDALDGAVTKLVDNRWCPVEVAPEHARLYNGLCRYNVSWPKEGETKEWNALAKEINNENQVLCVVNLKNHAVALLEILKHDETVFHLSTNLCALHRRRVLNEVRKRLKTGEPCRLISTQCVEAGVDVDFPVVYRALAPLDAIAQAAGRCNREGRLTDGEGNRKMGIVRVFEPAIDGDYRRRYPTRAYFQATEVMRSMLVMTGESGLNLNDPTVFSDYYHRLYDLNKPETQNKEFADAVSSIDFVRVAKAYRLIEKASIQVLVPYKPHLDLFNDLRQEQNELGISAKWTRRAQGLAVNIFEPSFNHPARCLLIPAKLRYGTGVSDEFYILEDRNGEYYNDVLGLRLPQSQPILIG